MNWLRRLLCSHSSGFTVSDDDFYVTKCMACGKTWADILEADQNVMRQREQASRDLYGQEPW